MVLRIMYYHVGDSDHDDHVTRGDDRGRQETVSYKQKSTSTDPQRHGVRDTLTCSVFTGLL